MANTIKLQDTIPDIGQHSRLEQYWKSQGFIDFHKKFRKGLPLPAKYQTIESLTRIIQVFHLKGVGFGNWLTQEDRYNYVCALLIALYDMNKVLKFKNNIGLNNRVAVSFGARGKGGALAHFEPGSFIINITRYVENSEYPKDYRFALTGGAGSLAHEYGHALDYYFGMYIDRSKEYSALTGGRITRLQLSQQNAGPFRYLVDQLLDAIIWRQVGKIKSAYYLRLEAAVDSDYFFRRNEIFARAFEKYVQVKLRDSGVSNTFLNDSKYNPDFYLTTAEMNKLMPQFDALIFHMRQVL